jgi:hypothetical protein
MDIVLNPAQVGLIVRGKQNEQHSPGVLAQHADCILSTGEPIGFFGGDPAYSGGSASGSVNRSGLNLTGFVADYNKLLQIRPYYVNATMAKSYGVISGVLIVDTDAAKAKAFDAFWKSLRNAPGSFSIMGKNCSTRASKAFYTAKITDRGIPGLDTPNNLYLQIKRCAPSCTSYFGHVGFTKRSDGRFDLQVL